MLWSIKTSALLMVSYFLVGGSVPAMCTWPREQFDNGAAASLLSRFPKKGSFDTNIRFNSCVVL